MKRINKIAIIILTYNRPESFKLTLRSVMLQKKVDFHVFVFDNHSTYSLKEFTSGNKKVTYIRRRVNIGFANNLRGAVSHVKRLDYLYAFLLSDDDLLAYPYVLYDLCKLMDGKKDVHVVRGGFADFVGYPPKVTRIITHDKELICKLAQMSEIEKALRLNINFYSGILFKLKLFDPYASKRDDLVTPFVVPLLKILVNKKFAFLTDKITVLAQTEHYQLATRVYNQNYLTTDDMEEAFKIIGMPYQRKTTIYELINYKIYSQKPEYVKKYYLECFQVNKHLTKIPYVIIRVLPKSWLKITKKLAQDILSFYSNLILSRYHPYVITSYV